MSVVNTCAVREKAEERVFGRLTQLLHYKTTNPDVVLGVTGSHSTTSSFRTRSGALLRSRDRSRA